MASAHDSNLNGLDRKSVFKYGEEEVSAVSLTTSDKADQQWIELRREKGKYYAGRTG